MPPADVRAPAGYVPRVAISFGNEAELAVPVSPASPMPVAVSSTQAPAQSTPLAGTLATSGPTAAFQPVLGRPIWLLLTGTWTGSVTLQRSVDNAVTWNPITYGDGSARPAFATNAQAVVAEESVAGALYRLQATLTSGTVGYRMEQ